jgi:hypothetical protein
MNSDTPSWKMVKKLKVDDYESKQKSPSSSHGKDNGMYP